MPVARHGPVKKPAYPRKWPAVVSFLVVWSVSDIKAESAQPPRDVPT